MTDPESRQHIAHVLSTVERDPAQPLPMQDWLAQSWQRSLQHHRLDPAATPYRRVLSAAELREAADRVGVLLDLARPHVDDLDRHVAPANYCILLTDASGLTIDYRNHGDTDNRFKRAGVRPGICWSEEAEGTCGIGTAIANRAAVLVHKTEHFRAGNIPLSCSAAPVFGLDDELLAVLDASTLYSPYQRDSQQLVFHLVKDKALAIENDFAEHSLRDHWRLAIRPGPASTRQRAAPAELLVAFDDSGRLLAANRAGRWLLDHATARRPQRIDELFDTTAEALVAQAHARPGVALPLRVLGTGELMHGVLRAPRQAAARGAARVSPTPATPAVPAAAPTPLGPLVPRPPAARPAGTPVRFETLATGDVQLRAMMLRACRLVDRDMPIMLLGETGTGKEVFAQALHAASQRAARPFVALNCAAIPESLIEAELFGYRDGAFTGARARGAKGKIAQADGGTLFLDEIGDMPLLLQSRLLRVLAEGEVMPLGADAPEPVTLHVICATHQDLPALIAQGRFREDLYYRLSGAAFRLPPLRARSDVAEVIQHLLREEAGPRRCTLADDALQALLAHPWPGNIRQLRHALRYACAVAPGEVLHRADFAADLWPAVVPTTPAPLAPPAAAAEPWGRTTAATNAATNAETTAAITADSAAHPAATQPLIDASKRETEGLGLDASQQAERARILQALRQHRWHASAAARALGLPRTTFYRRLRALHIVPPHRQAPDDGAGPDSGPHTPTG